MKQLSVKIRTEKKILLQSAKISLVKHYLIVSRRSFATKFSNITWISLRENEAVIAQNNDQRWREIVLSHIKVSLLVDFLSLLISITSNLRTTRSHYFYMKHSQINAIQSFPRKTYMKYPSARPSYAKTNFGKMERVLRRNL